MDDQNNPDSQQNPSQKSGNWKFTFLGGMSEIGPSDDNQAKLPQTFANQESFPLALSQVGDRVKILGFKTQEMVNQFHARGLTPGSELQVISRTPIGSVIVAVQDYYIGLGSAMANQILVTDSEH
ncbi:MAG: ferrous iron transport protein A [Moorea sp. SIO2I5]|nr:ferrous iron transport protein A [Moorena sp. SIO2I5]